MAWEESWPKRRPQNKGETGTAISLGTPWPPGAERPTTILLGSSHLDKASPLFGSWAPRGQRPLGNGPGLPILPTHFQEGRLRVHQLNL